MLSPIRYALALSAFAAAAFAVGCSEDDPSANLTVEFVPDLTQTGALTASDGTEITAFKLQLSGLKVLPDDPSATDKYKAKGTFMMDLLDSDSSTVDFTALEPAIYKKVEFKVDKPKAGEGLDGSDYAVLLEGAKDGVSFRYSDTKMDKITLRDVDGVDLAGGGSEVLIVNLAVTTWLSGVDLPALDQGQDDVAVISDQDNTAALDTIRQNIKDAIKIARKP